MIFGVAFGLAAAQTGLDNSASLLMSALVFAGASQFGALDLWGAQVPVVPLIVTVFAINARHLLMGATLYPWLRELPAAKRYGVMMVISDANWAMSMQAFNSGKSGIGLIWAVALHCGRPGCWAAGWGCILAVKSRTRSAWGWTWSWAAFCWRW